VVRRRQRSLGTNLQRLPYGTRTHLPPAELWRVILALRALYLLASWFALDNAPATTALRDRGCTGRSTRIERSWFLKLADSRPYADTNVTVLRWERPSPRFSFSRCSARRTRVRAGRRHIPALYTFTVYTHQALVLVPWTPCFTYARAHATRVHRHTNRRGGHLEKRRTNRILRAFILPLTPAGRRGQTTAQPVAPAIPSLPTTCHHPPPPAPRTCGAGDGTPAPPPRVFGHEHGMDK